MWRGFLTHTTVSLFALSVVIRRCEINTWSTNCGRPCSRRESAGSRGSLELVPPPAAVQRDGRALVADGVVGDLAGADLCQPLPLRRDVAGDVLRGERVVEDGVEQVCSAFDHRSVRRRGQPDEPELPGPISSAQ